MNEEVQVKKNIIKRGILLNRLLIANAILFFVIFTAGNLLSLADSYLLSMEMIILYMNLYKLFSFVLLVFSIVVFIKLNKDKVKGRGPLLASAIVMFVLSLFALVLGIVTFVLSLLSNRQLKEELKALDSVNVIDNNTLEL